MTQELIERLRKMAKQSSETSRMMAQSKSLRQAGHSPPRDDLYMWATPEQTTEWQAADALQSQSARIAELREVVEKCREKFDFYEQLHRLKCTAEGDEKADRNREMAAMCEVSLTKDSTSGGRDAEQSD